jgi:hypothetical protein
MTGRQDYGTVGGAGARISLSHLLNCIHSQTRDIVNKFCGMYMVNFECRTSYTYSVKSFHEISIKRTILQV